MKLFCIPGACSIGTPVVLEEIDIHVVLEKTRQAVRHMMDLEGLSA